MLQPQSDDLRETARRLIPGGVNSPVRSLAKVGGGFISVAEAQGAHLCDVDGHWYTDYVCSWGAALLGHAPPRVTEAVAAAAARGVSFGAPTRAETELARRILEPFRGQLDQVRLVSSGTEACMSAIRLARGVTQRPKIIKFDGNYHGHSDALLASAGSGLATLALADSAGVPPGAVADTLVVPYNDLAALEATLTCHRGQVAGIICEPICGNLNFIRPDPDFLPTLIQLAHADGALVIVDEVMTGFRVAWGGCTAAAGLDADIVCLGKVVGGGMPLAAYAGKRWVMKHVAPEGPVYQAGTLAGNPVSTAAGIAVMEELAARGEAAYRQLHAACEALLTGWGRAFTAAGLGFSADWEGGMFGFVLEPVYPTHLDAARRVDAARFSEFFWAMLEAGQWLAPSPFEAGFVSLAHTEEVIAASVAAAEQVVARLGGRV